MLRYAWLLDESVQSFLLDVADKNGVNYYLKETITFANYDFHDPSRTPRKDVRDDLMSMECAANFIVEKLGLKGFPRMQSITMVMVPKKLYSRAFSVYSNHDDADHRPNSDVVSALGKALGFKGMPAWYPHGSRFQWVEE